MECSFILLCCGGDYILASLSLFRIGRTARAGKAGLAFTFLLGVQKKNFLQMVLEAGSPGIQKQIIKPNNLKSMEARYGQTLQELASVIKVASEKPLLKVEIDRTSLV